MNYNSEIHTAVTVATRFAEHNQAARRADNALREFYMAIGTEFLSDADRLKLQAAVDVLQDIIVATRPAAVEPYLKNL